MLAIYIVRLLSYSESRLTAIEKLTSIKQQVRTFHTNPACLRQSLSRVRAWYAVEWGILCVTLIILIATIAGKHQQNRPKRMINLCINTLSSNTAQTTEPTELSQPKGKNSLAKSLVITNKSFIQFEHK